MRGKAPEMGTARLLPVFSLRIIRGAHREAELSTGNLREVRTLVGKEGFPMALLAPATRGRVIPHGRIRCAEMAPRRALVSPGLGGPRTPEKPQRPLDGLQPSPTGHPYPYCR
jgi:hypothetical protein